MKNGTLFPIFANYCNSKFHESMYYHSGKNISWSYVWNRANILWAETIDANMFRTFNHKSIKTRKHCSILEKIASNVSLYNSYLTWRE